MFCQFLLYSKVFQSYTHTHTHRRLHPWHMDVPRLTVELELQIPAYATAPATRDLRAASETYTIA